MPVHIEASPAEIKRARDLLRRRDELLIAQGAAAVVHRNFEPLPHQVPPLGEAGIDWFLWLLLGGRGAGKTDACAYFMNRHAEGPACIAGPSPHRMAIVAPTLGDGSESCVNGPSGLRAHNPQVQEITRKGGTFVIWPNGSIAKIFGAYTVQDPERLRAGGNRCFAWLEEIAAWRYLKTCWEHVQLGLLRLGSHPHAVASTTPRNRPTIKALIEMAGGTDTLTRAPTSSNIHLPAARRKKLYEAFGGTTLGRQELEGEMIEDVVGALWTEELIETYRVRPEDAPAERSRLVIAVDPSWGTTNDEVGVVAGYRAPDNHAYITEDLSGIHTPAEWGEIVARAYERLEADKVIAEGNFQGEQVRMVMRLAQQATGIVVHFELVHASRGKVLRAEPVVGAYQQGRVHHVGRLAGLEHQMTHWVPPRNAGPDGKDAGDPEDIAEPDEGEDKPSEYSPDRVDALVFLVTDLLLGSGGPASLGVAQGQIPGARRGRPVQSAGRYPTIAERRGRGR